MLKKLYFVLVIIALLTLPGCNQTAPPPQASSVDEYIVVIGNVPFIKQKDKFCGPAAMASVLQFYGQDIDQNEIAEQIYIAELNGALISDMENFARDSGYSTNSTNGDLKLLKSNLNNNHPVILLVDKGKWKVSVPHYYVAYGYNDEKKTIILHTGYKEAQEISFEKLDREWERMNRLMLVVSK